MLLATFQQKCRLNGERGKRTQQRKKAWWGGRKMFIIKITKHARSHAHSRAKSKNQTVHNIRIFRIEWSMCPCLPGSHSRRSRTSMHNYENRWRCLDLKFMPRFKPTIKRHRIVEMNWSINCDWWPLFSRCIAFNSYSSNDRRRLILKRW